MLEIINKSPFAANLYPGFDKDGKHQLTCVIKAGFKFNDQGQLQIMDVSPNIEEIDRFNGKRNQSSLLATSEIMPFKPRNEIILYGTAQVPSSDSIVTEASIRIKWPNNKIWQKQLRIFGQRIWQKTLLGTISSIPKSLQPIPIQYEYAYGGIGYPANPIGMGFTNKPFGNKNLMLPHIELMPKFINKITDRATPAGFAPLPGYWQAQSYSQAPSDQQFEQPFMGDEIISIKGMLANLSTTQEVTLKIPKTKPDLLLQLNQQQKILDAACDTVILNTDEQTMYLIWRTGIAWQINDQRNGVLIIKDFK
ncbi:MAG: hypothetical protein AMJ43_04610 [Coxiella sp. DG_40]|nr:MAG: hypothetical protein AMJ43_04610 [Coxiella sp. DG_40]